MMATLLKGQASSEPPPAPPPPKAQPKAKAAVGAPPPVAAAAKRPAPKVRECQLNIGWCSESLTCLFGDHDLGQGRGRGPNRDPVKKSHTLTIKDVRKRVFALG
jgi:hypothetical protein